MKWLSPFRQPQLAVGMEEYHFRGESAYLSHDAIADGELGQVCLIGQLGCKESLLLETAHLLDGKTIIVNPNDVNFQIGEGDLKSSLTAGT